MKKNLFYMLASVVLLSSCGDENSATSVGTTDGTVPLTIANAYMTASVLRSTQLLETGSIGLFRGTSNGYTAMNNVPYTLTYDMALHADLWVPDAAAITLSKNAANICAYHPYNASFTSIPFTLTSAPYTEEADISFVSNQAASSTSSTIDLTMIRAYSKISFVIKKDANYPQMGSVTSMTLANTGLKTSNTLDISTGNRGTTAATGTYTHALSLASLSTTAINSDGRLIEYLMVPCALTGSTTLTLTVDGNALQGIITNATLSALVAGSNHTITVIVSGASLVIGSVYTTDWATGAAATVTL